MAKANKDGWIRHRGGRCPVGAGELVDIRFRDGDIRIGKEGYSYMWDHSDSNGDIMAYRLHTPATQQEPKPMTAEEIRMQYMENLSSIAMLHTKNAALVDELRKLGFDFYTAEQESQEDMSDTKNWRVGDIIEAVATSSDGAYIKGSYYEISHIHTRNSDVYVVHTLLDSNGCRTNGWDRSNFKFHSRPSK